MSVYPTSANISGATSNLTSDSYNLLITHQPDVLTEDDLQNTNISFALAGHSHGTQITWPLLGAYQEVDGATKLNRDDGQRLSFDYYISTGIGCTNFNMRMNATPEIMYYTLRHR